MPHRIESKWNYFHTKLFSAKNDVAATRQEAFCDDRHFSNATQFQTLKLYNRLDAITMISLRKVQWAAQPQGVSPNQ
ncbi:MAG: hypothetical protein ACLUI8_09280 [Acutalibacteraceae bacterium]|uniref:hypothetical protein n=1 Tax=Candidatus Fimivicinus sp. TaxID=3056640 RepID=UPI0029086F29|nr:hypothetical protein [Clostridiales bacterium]